MQSNPNLLYLSRRHELYVPRWMADFDLLGIRELLASGRDYDVFGAYREYRESEKWTDTLGHVWFSDTFLIVAPDDSKESFESIDRIARYSWGLLLQKRIPLRGAISCDQFYADFDERIFFGPALVEAYDYGEGQDWIGLLLCPSAAKRLESFGIPSNVSYWALCDVLWKRRPHNAPEKIYACIHGKHPHDISLIPHLLQMELRCNREDGKDKINRTIEFLKQQGPPSS